MVAVSEPVLYPRPNRRTAKAKTSAIALRALGNSKACEREGESSFARLILLDFLMPIIPRTTRRGNGVRHSLGVRSCLVCILLKCMSVIVGAILKLE